MSSIYREHRELFRSRSKTVLMDTIIVAFVGFILGALGALFV